MDVVHEKKQETGYSHPTRNWRESKSMYTQQLWCPQMEVYIIGCRTSCKIPCVQHGET